MSNKQVALRAYLKWKEAGSPLNCGDQFWYAAEKEINDEHNKTKQVKNKTTEATTRYIAVKGVREIVSSNDLTTILEMVSKLETNVGLSDIVVWDLGTPSCPMMSVVASTCWGWVPIKIKGRQYLSQNFGTSFTSKEMCVLKQFFEVWKLDSGQTVVEAIKNIYEQTYVKDFKPGVGQVRLDRDEFKVFVSKLLTILSEKPPENKCNSNG